VWRRVLKDCEIRTTRTDDVAAKLWAFRRLQYTHHDRITALKKRPIAELRRLAVRGVEQLDSIADNVEYGEGERESLVEQRNVLLKGHISGQKLGLALGRDNHLLGKARVLSNLQSYGT
jgi:hypothetical protein